MEIIIQLFLALLTLWSLIGFGFWTCHDLNLEKLNIKQYFFVLFVAGPLTWVIMGMGFCIEKVLTFLK